MRRSRRRVTQTPAGAQLRDWLEGGRLSISALARRVGVAPAAVSQWLSGTARPKHQHRLALERITGILAVDWFTASERETAFPPNAA
jgi:transcriptional regulator with XRE-family HTH domain